MIGKIIITIVVVFISGGILYVTWTSEIDILKWFRDKLPIKEKSAVSKMSEKKKDKKINVGDESVVMGDVNGNVGNKSVVIGATDDKGNTIINQPGAYGYKAHAGPGSIAIGAYAGANSNISSLFTEINRIIISSQNESLIKSFSELVNEINKPHKDVSKIINLWTVIKQSDVLNNSLDLVEDASRYIENIQEN